MTARDDATTRQDGARGGEAMTQALWNRMNEAQKADYRTYNLLTPQLVGLEGWRVEVVTMNGDKDRFYVDRSTGWAPCHIALLRRDSTGGFSCHGEYKSVEKLYRMNDTTTGDTT